MLQRLIGALVAASLLELSSRGQDVKLEWKFKEGDKYTLETVSTFKQEMKTLGKTLKQDLKQTTGYSLTVQKVNADKSVVLEQKLESLALENQTGAPNPTDEKF